MPHTPRRLCQGVPTSRGSSRATRLHRSLELQRDQGNRLSCIVNATESSHGSGQSRQEIEADLRDAVRLEHYGRAAELRDLLESRQQNPASALKEKLDKLVAAEQYEVGRCKTSYGSALSRPFHLLGVLKASIPRMVATCNNVLQEAAKVRDQLRELVQQNIEAARERTTSDTLTEGVRIQVERYIGPAAMRDEIKCKKLQSFGKLAICLPSQPI